MADAKFNCETCIFWLDQKITGLCRRFPRYQNKHKNEWCGEYVSELGIAETRQKRKYVRKTDVKTDAE